MTHTKAEVAQLVGNRVICLHNYGANIQFTNGCNIPVGSLGVITDYYYDKDHVGCFITWDPPAHWASPRAYWGLPDSMRDNLEHPGFELYAPTHLCAGCDKVIDDTDYLCIECRNAS